jgi:hypothetical protein
MSIHLLCDGIYHLAIPFHTHHGERLAAKLPLNNSMRTDEQTLEGWGRLVVKVEVVACQLKSKTRPKLMR